MGRTNALGSPIITWPLTNDDIASNAAIAASKMQHAYLFEKNFGLATNGTPVSRIEYVHTANGSETVTGFHVGMIDTGSAASSTFDLLKNGVSILSAVVTVANADPDGTKKNGTIASPTLVDGDILTVQIAVSSSTGATGPFAQVAVVGNASPT